jgi:hypothetical protein
MLLTIRIRVEVTGCVLRRKQVEHAVLRRRARHRHVGELSDTMRPLGPEARIYPSWGVQYNAQRGIKSTHSRSTRLQDSSRALVSLDLCSDELGEGAARR